MNETPVTNKKKKIKIKRYEKIPNNDILKNAATEKNNINSNK
jgi:hypothetical protein